ncbi:MAG: DUF3307 domain-containing protein [Paracoccaceae bacterium]
MIETFVALIFAHVLADYLLQPAWMVARKRNPGILLAHGAVVLAVSMAALGRVDAWQVLALGAAHLVIDAVKTYVVRDTLATHLADQAAHVASVLVVAFWAPGLWASGVWAEAPPVVLHLMILGAGFLVATRAGAFAIARLMAAQTAPGANSEGLPKGGTMIGLLERGLIFVLILAGQAAGIGFLIAAKSILRFGTVNENRAASEYVIIGTLASFGWAITVTLATLALRDLLPPLEIGRLRP